jgi:hypothetical protein
MRVPDEVLMCVAYLGLPTTDAEGRPAMQPGATAFFVNMPSTVEGNTFVYLVTARHVAEKIQGREFMLRANLRDGGAFFGQGDAETKWRYHPSDDSVDVAVTSWVPPESVEYKAVPVSMFLDDNIIRDEQIGPGDEVFATGLFVRLVGRERNLPIVRTGNIAMMPSEPVPTGLGPMDAYLIEARSLGGLSGSPAFVHRVRSFHFLGLMHGHWDVPDRQGAVNMGIAIVVPARKILEVLEQPLLQAARQKHDEGLRAAAL